MGFTTFISQKTVTNSSILGHGKGPRFPLITMVFGKKSFFIWQKSNSILQPFMQQSFIVIAKLYFPTVRSRPLLGSKIEFQQQTFTAFSCKLLLQRAPSSFYGRNHLIFLFNSHLLEAALYGSNYKIMLQKRMIQQYLQYLRWMSFRLKLITFTS